MGIQLNPDNPNLANQIAAVMALESAGTFAPDKRNQNNGRAVGLIQFLPSTAKLLGTTTEALIDMTPSEQLEKVQQYFSSFSYTFSSVDDVYMAVFAPSGLSKAQDEVLYEPGSDESNNNLYLDRVGGNNDGKITKREATQAVINTALEYGENLAFLEDYRKHTSA